MWQEARKQERHIKTLMVDYKRRAERRRDFYERIKQDPIKFLRVYGRPAKLHLDSEVVKAAENPNNMMPWTGDPSILIDRFDVRANLEHYDGQFPDDLKLTSVERIEERLCMYERYRCLIHNDYAGVSEAMALKQIDVDEKYGDLEKKRKEEEEASKKSQEPKAAIGFTYEDSHPPSTGPAVGGGHHPIPVTEDSDSEGEADSDMDIDVELDLATLSIEGRRQLAKSAASFGLHASDFVRLLDADQQLETELRLAKALEEEKLQLAGRKSRRARRLLRERRAPEKFPKTLSLKVGLLNGQPISRRTVYLSASSSDSGEYASDEDDDDVNASRSPNSKAVALREQRAKAKPILTTAKGPSILIGGMTSIGLCRRRRYGDSGGDKTNKQASGRGSSSSSSASDVRGPHSSTASGPHRASRRGARDSSRRHQKRPRVEYITTFGDNDDEEETGNLGDRIARSSNLSAPSWRMEKEPGTAASAVAASVVSKLLGSDSRPRSPLGIRPSSSSKDLSRGTPSHPEFKQQQGRRRDSFGRSSPHDGYRRHASSSTSSSRSSSRSRTRSRSISSRSASGRYNRGSYRSRQPYRRQSPAARHRRTGSSRDSDDDGRRRRRNLTSSDYRRRSPAGGSSGSSRSPPRNSVSRSVCDRHVRSKSSRSGSRASSAGSVVSAAVDTVAKAKEPTPPVQRRYYRPELESDDNSQLSEDAEEDGKTNDQNTECPASAAATTTAATGGGTSLSSRLSDQPMQQQCRRSLDSPLNTTGKTMTTPQSVSGTSTMTKTTTPAVATATGAVPRLTPQELLKRRVQAQLTKAFNADKKAELEKQVQLEQERQAREEGLRRQALLLRRQEEKRQRAERRAAIQAAGGTVDESDSSSSSSTSMAATRPRRSTGHGRSSPPSPMSSASRNRATVPRASSPPSSPPRSRRSRSPACRSPFRSSRLPSPPPPPNSARGGSNYSQSREFAPKMHPIGGSAWKDRSSHGPAYYESRGPRGRTAPRPDRYHGSDRYHTADSGRADYSYAPRDPRWQFHSPRGSGRPWAPPGLDDRRSAVPRGPYRSAETRHCPAEQRDYTSRFDSGRGPRTYSGRS